MGDIMEPEKKPHSDKEKSDASVELLAKLKGRLYSDNVSIARRAAYNLAWLQEDGLDILKDALFGDTRRTAKTAAAYGMRNTRGRMKKMAKECLEQGMEHSNKYVREACKRALILLDRKRVRKSPSEGSEDQAKFRIEEISTKTTKRPKPRRVDHRNNSVRPRRLQTR